jgi:hypothetical protein
MKKSQLVYMKDACGNNLKVFKSVLEASEYLGIDHFELLKHINGLPLEHLPFKFEVKEGREL